MAAAVEFPRRAWTDLAPVAWSALRQWLGCAGLLMIVALLRL